MPYFLILPVFALLLAVEALAVLCCALVPSLRKALPYGWRMLVGSGAGFVAGNVASVLLGVVPVLLATALHVDRDAPAAQVVAGFALLGLFIGPLVVSPLGFLGGAWLGLKRAARAGHSATAPVRQ